MQSPFLQVFYPAIIGASVLSFAGAIGFYIYHQVKVASIEDPKQKYDHIIATEIRHYKIVWIMISLAIGLLVNLYGRNAGGMSSVGVWFFVRVFFGIAAATTVGYISTLLVQFYYPTILNRKLNRWRYEPRVNPATGSKMKLLSEDLEDVHLDAGMQEEEKVFSVDYDVWIDERTREVRIDKYPGNLTALKCNSCNFHTMKVEWEEIVEREADGSPRELVKHYRCSYCKKIRATQFKVSKKEAEDYRQMEMKFGSNLRGVESIQVEISSATGRQKLEFNDMDQARKFLEDQQKGEA